MFMAPRIDRQAAQVGVLVGLGNLLIFNHFLPPVADVKTADPFNMHVESSERTALFVGIGFSVVAAAYVKSWDTFFVAGAVLLAADFAYKHANAVHPDTGKMVHPNGAGVAGGTNAQAYPMPDYSAADAAA
jgi:hypothetical protein